ncbi:protease inhibitor I42 family protein [Nocardia neocaledoniensis]|uniref:protease inhibitor I42 family protein n=1 Tax=Nocardia neocaledoniensis TaxID=236511 RepID=UPI0024582014|nr:protease inhibitor I42 family protein [Nocardia neocaledoniensis]
MRKILLAVCAVAMTVTGCGDDDDSAGTLSSTTIRLPAAAPQSAAGPVEVDERFNGSTVALELGQRLLVRLPQNSNDTDSWSPVNVERGVLAPEPPVSEGTSMLWPFLGVGPGTSTIQFAYGPASEAPIEPGPEFVITVRVA